MLPSHIAARQPSNCTQRLHGAASTEQAKLSHGYQWRAEVDVMPDLSSKRVVQLSLSIIRVVQLS